MTIDFSKQQHQKKFRLTCSVEKITVSPLKTQLLILHVKGEGANLLHEKDIKGLVC